MFDLENKDDQVDISNLSDNQKHRIVEFKDELDKQGTINRNQIVSLENYVGCNIISNECEIDIIPTTASSTGFDEVYHIVNGVIKKMNLSDDKRSDTITDVPSVSDIIDLMSEVRYHLENYHNILSSIKSNYNDDVHNTIFKKENLTEWRKDGEFKKLTDISYVENIFNLLGRPNKYVENTLGNHDRYINYIENIKHITDNKSEDDQLPFFSMLLQDEFELKEENLLIKNITLRDVEKVVNNIYSILDVISKEIQSIDKYQNRVINDLRVYASNGIPIYKHTVKRLRSMHAMLHDDNSLQALKMVSFFISTILLSNTEKTN